MFMLNVVYEINSNGFKPDGFNLDSNVGNTAEKKDHYVHIHLISRYSGDVKNITGELSGVIFKMREY